MTLGIIGLGLNRQFSNNNEDKPNVKEQTKKEVVDGITKVTDTNYSYEYTDDNEMSRLISFKIGNKDIKDTLEDYILIDSVNKYDDIIIVKTSVYATSGSDTYGLIVYDYDGNKLYQDNKGENVDIIGFMVFNSYEYNNSTKVLKIKYILDCNIMGDDDDRCFDYYNTIYDVVNIEDTNCSDIEEFKTTKSSKTYELKLNNKSFSEPSLIASTNMIDDDNYNKEFNLCKK